MSEPDVVSPQARRWTHIDDYLGAFARRVSARRSRRPGARTEPETPRLLLSTLPFAALILVLAVLAVAIAIAAWPPTQPKIERPEAPARQGTAAPGWLDQAKKEMR